MRLPSNHSFTRYWILEQLYFVEKLRQVVSWVGCRQCLEYLTTVCFWLLSGQQRWQAWGYENESQDLKCGQSLLKAPQWMWTAESLKHSQQACKHHHFDAWLDGYMSWEWTGRRALGSIAKLVWKCIFPLEDSLARLERYWDVTGDCSKYEDKVINLKCF